MMKLVVPTLDLEPGKIHCLHIPHGCHTAGDALEQDLLKLVIDCGKKAALCPPAGIERSPIAQRPRWYSPLLAWHARWRNRPSLPTVLWFSRVAGLSENASKEIIDGLDEKIGDRLYWNAGTPRSLLGIAARLVHEPDVVVYSTAGLDLQGCQEVHEFVVSRAGRFCAIHIAFPSVYGDGTPHPRQCPPRATCTELALVSSR
jgi:hypothetical protein